MAKHISPVAGGTVDPQRAANSTKLSRIVNNEKRMPKFRDLQGTAMQFKNMGYCDHNEGPSNSIRKKKRGWCISRSARPA